MITTFFDKFFSNNFNSKNIIDERLQAFVRLLIQTLTLNNPSGIFDDDILALTTDYNAYFIEYNVREVNAADSVSSTVTIDQATRTFIDGVRSNYSAITKVYPIGSAIYKEFFPKGKSEFSHISRTNVQTVSHRMTVKTELYKASLGGAPFASLFAGYETTINTSLVSQNKSQGKLKKSQGSVHKSRVPVEDACMGAMYSVGKAFASDFVTCNTYFNFSLLYSDLPSTTILRLGVVPGNATALCIDSAIVSKSVFLIKNKSDLPQQYYGTKVLNGEMVGILIDVAAHTDKTVHFTEFGSADILFLYVKNNTDYSGNWEVKMEKV